MLTLITIPETALADIMEASGILTTDLWILLAIALGIPIFFYLVKRVKGWFAH